MRWILIVLLALHFHAVAKGEVVVNYADLKGKNTSTSALLTLHPKKFLTVSGFLGTMQQAGVKSETQEANVDYGIIGNRLHVTAGVKQSGPDSARNQMTTFKTSLTAIRGLTFTGGYTQENKASGVDAVHSDLSMGLSLGGLGNVAGNREETILGSAKTRTYKLLYGKQSSDTNITLDAKMVERNGTTPDVNTTATLKVVW